MSITLAEAKKFPKVAVISPYSRFRGVQGRVVNFSGEHGRVKVSLVGWSCIWYDFQEVQILPEVEAVPEPPATTTSLPTVYVIRGPVSGELSVKAREIYADTPAVTYLLGAYFNRPDGKFSYNPDELENAVEYLSRRVRNFLESGLGKSLIIDGVPYVNLTEALVAAVAAGYIVKSEP